MESRKSRFWLAPILVLACLLVQPAALQSQCGLSPVSVGMPGGATITVFQAFTNPSYQCVATVSNAYGCYPAVAPDTMTVPFLLASAMTSTTATMAVACQWNCACGTVRIDGTDGLPVELMDFGFEDEEASGDAPENAEGR